MFLEAGFWNPPCLNRTASTEERLNEIERWPNYAKHLITYVNIIRGIDNSMSRQVYLLAYPLWNSFKAVVRFLGCACQRSQVFLSSPSRSRRSKYHRSDTSQSYLGLGVSGSSILRALL
ncbi:hypothetical protein VFPPC_18194 [Pochonia chlamydosporia 170]|uniref:Uncharacterized protein n=1 Tax=Pochonia chlamydosporia 170 TaxID=1380566 RepID=A0A219AQP7_METCM|nr:hypothetical protein VFPPC_18194 [Pochonia chlamydosporia 170]OWT42634.1 hypothetical protein VFPPC_18194 [Pochonia chlamydosporia 170]